MIQAQRHCKTCDRKTLHAKQQFSTGWGCFLTVITAGLFIPVWLLLGFFEAFRPWRCQQCGKGRLT